MRERLLELLACPCCGGSFTERTFSEIEGEIVEGLLTCQCGEAYPIINAIPRLLPNAFHEHPEFLQKYGEEIKQPVGGFDKQLETDLDRLQKRTQKSFGYQWTAFSEMIEEFRENFLNYTYPIKPSFFKGKIGLDAGCGFGRHIYYAAEFGAEMVGIDLSAAIDSAYQNTKHLRNVHLVQGDIYKLPFREKAFDFAYSIGVLHHLPDPERGFHSLLPLLKPNSSIFIWVYSKKRVRTNAALESARKITCRIPHGFLLRLCFLAALLDWALFIQPYKTLRTISSLTETMDRFMFPRIKLYARYPFQVCYADWFDRLSAPIRFYYSEEELEKWFEKANLRNVRISPTGNYGWRAYGES